MKLYLNTGTGLLTLTEGASQSLKKLDCKGDSYTIEVVADPAFPVGATGLLAAKADGVYTGDPVVLDAMWSDPVGDQEGPTFTLDLTTEELLDLFVAEAASVTLMAEIVWDASGIVCRSQTFQIVVARSVYATGSGTPSPTQAPPSFRLTSPDSSQWTVSITNDGQLNVSKQ